VTRHLALLAAAAALAPAALAADPAASGIRVDVKPLKGGKAYGTVTVYAQRGAAAALVDVRGLRSHATVRALVEAGDCGRHGASFATLPALRADARGNAHGRGFVRFHGAKVALTALTGEPARHHRARERPPSRAALCSRRFRQYPRT
jgi:hypothetical protein